MPINSKNFPLVSIIMNCYNGQKFIAESVKSILAQTYKNFEVIFWDNQSNDNSAEIYKSFKDKRLKYYYANTHTSLYEARNFAIKKAKGKLISFLDTDDLWIKDKLNLQVKKFRNKKIGLVYSNYYILNQITGFKKKFYKRRLPEGFIFENLLKEYFIGICTVMLKRSIFQNNRQLFNKKYNIIGDFDLFMRISKKNYFSSINFPLAIYRVHNKSLSNQNYKMHISELKFWIKNQKNLSENDLFYIKKKIEYMDILFNLINKKKSIFLLKKIFKIKFSIIKIKLIVFYLIPNFLLKKIKEIL